jgi:hypothetical protein
MNEIKILSNSLEQTLKDSDLQFVTIDLAESFSDSLMNESLLKDIPIIGTLVGLTKTAISIKDRLLIKKLIYFISELKDIDQSRRVKLISEIDKSETQKIKIGEKLLYIIDRSDDHYTAKYIAVLFKAFLNEEINYSQFLRCSAIIQKLLIQDLEEFIETEIKDIETSISQYDKGISDFQNSLINSGICATETERVSIHDQEDYKMNDKYVVKGGDLIIYFTEIGHTLKKVLKTKLL